MGGLIADSQEDYKILTLSMNQVFTVDELKQVKAKNDILMHTEKTYTVTEIAKELGVSSARILNQILFKDHIRLNRVSLLAAT